MTGNWIQNEKRSHHVKVKSLHNSILYSQLKNKGYENCKIYQYMYFYYILFL